MAHWDCPSCGRRYAYELETCSWCRVGLERRDPAAVTVEAVTEVAVPSVGHEDVPYWCALVRAPDGSRTIVKTDRAVSVGDTLEFGAEATHELDVVGVLGTGTMGSSLVELMLQRGHRVVWLSRSEERVEGARARVMDRLARHMDEDELMEAGVRLTATASPDDLAVCDVVIEAALEELEAKKALLRDIEPHLRDDAVLATNTSGLPLDELSAVLERPERFGGLHFFNPATRMRLVETSTAPETSREVSAELDEFSRALGKIPVRVAARPAFVVNRVLMPLINEAVRSLEEDAAPAESIDEAVRLGLNHPMGPLALADLIGLDVVVKIMDNLVERTGDAGYEPRPLLRAKVDAGELGRKTGVGFYEHA